MEDNRFETIDTLYSMSVFKNLLNDNVVKSILKLKYATKERRFARLCGNIYSALLDNDCATIADYLFKVLCKDKNPFSIKMCCGIPKKLPLMHIERANAEYNMLSMLCNYSISKACRATNHFSDEFLASMPNWEAGILPDLSELMDNYIKKGYGVFSESVAYIWNCQTQSLDPVHSINPVRLNDLKDYREEKQELINNTLNFLYGKAATNALLYGERGTGKSSTISAILNEFSHMGLRIIELSKSGISQLPLITAQISNLHFKFIIFIDDLSFVSGESDYAMLKATLEGSVNKSNNTLIYATSNRRHLIAESHSERNDDVHAGDTMQEQLSLADRFGLVITFLSTDKKEFLSILTQILDEKNYKYDIEELIIFAEKQAIRKGGRSPRLAAQIAATLLSQKQLL